MLETKNQFPLACDLTAIPPGDRAVHVESGTHLFQQATSFHELVNGFLLEFPNDGAVLLQIAKFVEHERECCPFLGFTIELEPERGSMWLKLVGREGVKALLRQELLSRVHSTVASAANLR